jgi:hypothetical protein
LKGSSGIGGPGGSSGGAMPGPVSRGCGQYFVRTKLACFLAAQILVRTSFVYGPFSRGSADFVGFLSERGAKK